MSSGYLMYGFFLVLNVLLALGTGWDQMYVQFLPIFVWDTPANVIGVSPISMILDSVAVMLILDLDEKAYLTIVKAGMAEHVRRLEKHLEEADVHYGSLADAHEIA